MPEELVARSVRVTPEGLLREQFAAQLGPDQLVDAVFLDSGFGTVFGLAGLPQRAPVALELLHDDELAYALLELAGGGSLLLVYRGPDVALSLVRHGDRRKGAPKGAPALPVELERRAREVVVASAGWAGALNERGEQVIDLRTPSPGPHFSTNLLLGNRVGFDHPLQTTPKSVVDRLGRGSFRSHAATQVLATRWDMRQEENGFPANRQFYLVERCRTIFYSADPNDANVETATCVHSQNHTTITYTTRCGLTIRRTIFLLPQEEGLPPAVEAQQIEVTNRGAASRQLTLVCTGMFGSATPDALQGDVLYTNITLQSKLVRADDGSILAVGTDYYPYYSADDMRFHSMLIHGPDGVRYPRSFCASYNDFVGSGTLERPAGVYPLSNRPNRKGPGFFALAGELPLGPGATILVDNFTGLVSKRITPAAGADIFQQELGRLLERYARPGETARALERQRAFLERYSSFLQVRSGDQAFDTYVNKNLPFQVLYQTFVSRSFDQTQKGYREIGFREIQDVFASMYYFVSMGLADFVKELICSWCSQVYEFGYAHHNFYWVGKEPGTHSDDGLWLIQAVYRYVRLTGDPSLLDATCDVAGAAPPRRRSVYETIQAVLRYSGEISIGKHGMPLLDHADWNDTLSIDHDWVNGPTKERLYQEQVAAGGGEVQPFESNLSESVMNAFLLKLALDEMAQLARQRGDAAYQGKLEQLSARLQENLQRHAWKGDFFARVLLNREGSPYTYLGGQGDGLSSDPKLPGSYFLNSFGWSILAEAADEEQIGTMLDMVERALKTPYGLQLCSPTDLRKIARRSATDHYWHGDRENGAVFKHASMMATAAMLKAAKEVADPALAARLARLAYWMIDLVLPYKTLEHPFETAGHPRLCTQYNNTETGENVGPTLSGTSTWLTLCLFAAFGVEFTAQGIALSPILREEQQALELRLNTGRASYVIRVSKPAGFYRLGEQGGRLTLDGQILPGAIVPLLEDGQEHVVELAL